MKIILSEEYNKILLYARDESMRTGSYAICADHLMLGLLRHNNNEACSILNSLGVDLVELKRFVDSKLFRQHSVPYSARDKMTVARDAQNAINMSAYESIKTGSSDVRSEHLLIAVARSLDSATSQFLASAGISVADLESRLKTGKVEGCGNMTEGQKAEMKDYMASTVKSIIYITPNRERIIPS